MVARKRSIGPSIDVISLSVGRPIADFHRDQPCCGAAFPKAAIHACFGIYDFWKSEPIGAQGLIIQVSYSGSGLSYVFVGAWLDAWIQLSVS